MPFVLDASCALALLFNEPSLDRIPDLHLRIASDGVYVPPLWKWEVGNSIVLAVRRVPAAIEDLMAQLLLFERFPIAIDEESLDSAWGPTTVLSLKHRLTAYDAAYLETSIRPGLPLASFDKALTTAARAEGVEVIGG